MAILGPVVDPGCRFDEHMFDASQRGHLRFCSRITAQLVSDDLAWATRILDQQLLEEALGGCLVTALLQQYVELGAMLIDGTPSQLRFTADVDEDFVQMPGGSG